MDQPPQNDNPVGRYFTRSRARAGLIDPDAHVELPAPRRARTDWEGARVLFQIPQTTRPVGPAPPAPDPFEQSRGRGRTQSRGSGKQEDPKVKAFRERLLRELGDEVPIVDECWARGLYDDIVEASQLETFLSSPSSGYVTDSLGRGRWGCIPSNPRMVPQLSRSVSKLMSKIVGEFCAPSPAGVSRRVVDGFYAGYKQPRYALMCPHISIVATGPSFERPKDSEEYVGGVGYSNVASSVDVILDRNASDVRKQASYGAMYSRHIFMKQPNREFVRSLVVTETRVRLLHYDRSGVYVTPFINYHDDPHAFIHFVIGLISTDEQILGLDTTVRWAVDESSGRRVSGVLEAPDSDGTLASFNLEVEDPHLVREEISGKGTTGWRATHPVTGKPICIKDSWRSESNQAPELEFLEAVKGVQGVVQLVSGQENLASTRALRPEGFHAKAFRNRTKSRIVLGRCGPALDQFKTRKEVIAALRDALAGYCELIKKQILHRDISMENIMLGLPGAQPGSRGILVDFDVAVWLFADRDVQMYGFPVGTRRFQSVQLHRALKMELPPPHDPLDDLESFFHVLSRLVSGFTEPGVVAPTAESIFEGFDDEDTGLAAIHKAGFICQQWQHLSSWWGEPCETLCAKFSEILVEVLRGRSRVRDSRGVTPEQRLEIAAELSARSEEFFQRVLCLFDNALSDIEGEDVATAESASSLPTAHASVPFPQPSRQDAITALHPTNPTLTLKRKAEEVQRIAPPGKRSCTGKGDNPE